MQSEVADRVLKAIDDEGVGLAGHGGERDLLSRGHDQKLPRTSTAAPPLSGVMSTTAVGGFSRFVG